MKKTTKTKKTTKVKKVITSALPQNIIMMGERTLENKNIYIHQKVYNAIQKFASNKTENEHGGILVGRVVNKLDKENTIIEGFIEAKHNEATPTTLTFTHETWDHFHKEMDKKYKDKKIVGWIHTHPNFGIFLSENDKFIQQNFFNGQNQVAYVVDPIQHEEGFYYWIDEKLEKCPGFYIFDKNGVTIKQRKYDTENDYGISSGKSSLFTKIWMTFLTIALAFCMVFNFLQADRIKKLESSVADQEIIMQYQLTGGRFINGELPELSQIAKNIRMQVEAIKEMHQKSLKQNMIQPEEQGNSEAKTGETTTENSESKTDKTTENPVKTTTEGNSDGGKTTTEQ